MSEKNNPQKEVQSNAPNDPVVVTNNSILDTPESTDRRSYTAQERREIESQILAERNERQDSANIISDFIIASKNGNILTAEIAGVHIDDTSVSWVCYRGPITIHIPFQEAFDILPELLLDPDAENVILRRQQFLQKSIGVEIPFVITGFSADPKSANQDYIAIGSRVKALSRIRRRYYGPDAYNPDTKGMNVNAQIISTGAGALWLCFHGVDVRVANKDLTHRFCPNLKERYAPGDIVRVKITNIDTTDPQNPVVTVSGREVELEEAQRNIFRIKEGDIYAATVVTMRSKPSMLISLWLEGIDVPGYAATKEVTPLNFVHSGDKVYVKVLGITKNGYIHTRIIRKAGRH